ncbi:UNVERIFIED_CONTAM: hypothetical protein FKN15_028425 [Acipenser sinensis]
MAAMADACTDNCSTPSRDYCYTARIRSTVLQGLPFGGVPTVLALDFMCFLGFAAFERNILTQVEQIMLSKERLLKRTQTKRSEYRVLGQPEQEVTAATVLEPEAPMHAAVCQCCSCHVPVQSPAQGYSSSVPHLGLNPRPSGQESRERANAHLKDLDEEIFDDDDFYHQLLRELIEKKTSALDANDQVAMGRQWLAIQKLRSKIKKKMDTKASKGRKVRYVLILLNPVCALLYACTWESVAAGGSSGISSIDGF